jgi:HSP20 family molecular chaperone IbpA
MNNFLLLINMSDREKFKNASNNVIDIMSNLGKQFVDEALEQGEPIWNILSQLSKPERESETKTNIFNKDKWIVVNEMIKYHGEAGIYSEVIEDKTAFTILFILPGVNKQDFILEKNDTSLAIFCKTSISDSRISEFKYPEREIKFTLKFNYDIQCHNILAELRDGLLKINVEKPFQNTDDELITLV